jgi:hypothetical protein
VYPEGVIVLTRCRWPPIHDRQHGGAARQCRTSAGRGRKFNAESFPAWFVGSVELTAYGAVSERTDTTLSVRSEDGTVSTCDVPPGLDLSAFPVGTQVKLRCHRPDGRLRLGFVESGKAVVEVPH